MQHVRHRKRAGAAKMLTMQRCGQRKDADNANTVTPKDAGHHKQAGYRKQAGLHERAGGSKHADSRTLKPRADFSSCRQLKRAGTANRPTSRKMLITQIRSTANALGAGTLEVHALNTLDARNTPTAEHATPNRADIQPANTQSPRRCKHVWHRQQASAANMLTTQRCGPRINADNANTVTKMRRPPQTSRTSRTRRTPETR